MSPKYSIICLIFQSTDWLEFVYHQVLKYTDMEDTEFFFVANDATEKVLHYLNDHNIPHYISNNTKEQKKEWYINNVYRAYNFGASQAKGDFLIFINSDMAFSPHWLENLIKAYNGSNCLCTRLVESGKMPSGTYGVTQNFGRTPQTYNEAGFQEYVKKVAIKKVADGGLYGALFIRKKHFLAVGGYPEGNILPESDIFHPKYAIKGEFCIPGDAVLMAKLKTKNILHHTVFNSIAYHFQEGEKDSSSTLQVKKRIKNIVLKTKKFLGFFVV
jgi:glycosyltransferase involved in cell wall biosynthesis